MFEIPECVTLARQIDQTLKGKTILKGNLGNSPHKFVWYNRSHEEFAEITREKVIGPVTSRAKWLFIDLLPGYRLVLGECGGKLLFHKAGIDLPEKYHLLVNFTDGTAISAFTRMWGAMELYKTGEEQERFYIKGMRTTPVDPEFTLEYFYQLINSHLSGEKRSVKGLLTLDQLIPGLGNSITQDILFNARLHPKHPLDTLDTSQRASLYHAIRKTVSDIIQMGGRYDETDLFNKPGGYVRLMDSKTAGQPCRTCGTTIEKIQYLGGACYFCPTCQE